jgi:hypothetical protein
LVKTSSISRREEETQRRALPLKGQQPQLGLAALVPLQQPGEMLLPPQLGETPQPLQPGETLLQPVRIASPKT